MMPLRRGKERAKEQLQAVRAEKPGLDSLATIEQARDLWRLHDEARARSFPCSGYHVDFCLDFCLA
jgi:hypothetical protein